jgi:hypothetical protein
MKRSHTSLVGCVAVLIIASAVYAQRKANELAMVPKAYSDLLAKVERLEEQVARLEAQVQDLRGRRNVIVTPPLPAPAPSPLPKGWQEREFNGVRYFIVPCEATGAAPTTQPVK